MNLSFYIYQNNRNFCLIVDRKVILKNMFWARCAPICTLYILISWVPSFDQSLLTFDSCLYLFIEIFSGQKFDKMQVCVQYNRAQAHKQSSAKEFGWNMTCSQAHVQTTVDKLRWKLSVKGTDSRDKYVQCTYSCTMCSKHVL